MGTCFSWGRGCPITAKGAAWLEEGAGSLRRLSFGKLSECSSGRHGLIQSWKTLSALSWGLEGHEGNQE